MKIAPVVLRSDQLVEKSHLADRELPLVITPRGENVDVCRWSASNRTAIDEDLSRYGAILFRGFSVGGAERFREFIEAVSTGPLSYSERSSPRTHMSGNIYTSTEHPNDQEIFLHNEQSYNVQMPLKIAFYCERRADSGGETPIADCRRVYRRLKRETIERFVDGYLYERMFSEGFGMSWQEAFQTQDERGVDEYCALNEIQREWLAGGVLRTRQVRPVIAKHPRTQELVWCNHLTFFNVKTLPKELQELLEENCAGRLPHNTYHADGSEIEDAVLAELVDAYRSETVTFTWQEGDVLLLDNMMVAHGRRPFSGSRRVLVGMADLQRWDECRVEPAN